MPMKNLPFEPVEYKVEETALGVWRRFSYEDSEEYRILRENLDRYQAEHPRYGLIWASLSRSAVKGAQYAFFEEFVSHKRLFGLPLLHYTRGRCPETGRSQCAKGIVAIGRMAIGLIAIGQFSLGLISVAQFGIGAFLGLGQFTTGVLAIGQIAIGLAFGFGQFVTGFVAIGQCAAGFLAIGQLAAGYYVLAMKGIGVHVWDMSP